MLSRLKQHLIVTIGLAMMLGGWVREGQGSPYLTHQTIKPSNSQGQFQSPRTAQTLSVAAPSPNLDALERVNGSEREIVQSAPAIPIPPPTSGLKTLSSRIANPFHTAQLDSARLKIPRQVVPEPASIVLVVTGLIGLAARRYLHQHRP